MASITDVLLRILEPNNLFLLISLVIVLVIGYKVLKTLTSVLIVSILSGGFFILLNYLSITGLDINIANVLGFMIIGTFLYIFFTVFFMTTNFFRKTFNLLRKLFIILISPVKSLSRRISKKIDEISKEKAKEKKKEKSVILEES